MKSLYLALALAVLPATYAFAGDGKEVVPAPQKGEEIVKEKEKEQGQEQGQEDQMGEQSGAEDQMDIGDENAESYYPRDGRRGRRFMETVCRARNARGQVFVGRAWNRGWAHNEAMQRCYRWSRHCWSLGCRREWRWRF